MPVRCQGTHWISHKRKALQRVIDRYGAYINHIATLSEDQIIASADRARLQGFFSSKWMNFKMLIGAAMYTDIPSCLSLMLQEEEIDVIKRIQHLLKSRKISSEFVKAKSIRVPSVSVVYSRIVEDETSKAQSYLGVTLSNCSSKIFSNIPLKQLKICNVLMRN